MEPTAALPADGKGTAAHDASADAAALLGVGVEAPMKEADQEPSVEEDTAANLSAGKKPVLSEDPAAGKQVSVGEKPAPSVEPAEKQQNVSVGEKPSPYPVAGKQEAFAGKKPVPFEEPAEEKQKNVGAEEKTASYEDPASEDKEAADKGDGRADLPVDMADLPVDMVVAVAARLPSKAAARSVVLSKNYRERVGEPVFLMSNLAPRTRFFVGDTVVPNTVVLQPADKGLRQGYTHLTIIDVKPRRNFIYDMPVRFAYDDDDHDDGDYYEYAVTDIDVGPQQVKTPPPFFCKTVPELDLQLLASEGRLLLAHSPTHGLFVCDAREDRYVRLPTTPFADIDSRRTATAIHYKLGCWGEIDKFDVVLLSPLPSGHAVLQTFSFFTDGGGHGDGGWVVTDIGEDSVVSALAGVRALGIYAGDAFYWINDHSGSLIQYLIEDRLLSVVPPPPETDGYPSRMGWALGSVDGLLRLSSFSLPAEVQNTNGILSVWIKKETQWVIAKELAVPVSWVFEVYRGLEIPIDMARANGERLMVRKDRDVLWRDLKGDEIEFVSNVYLRLDSELHRVYSRFKAFCV